MLQPGHVINETYRVEKLLGSGGMADVYVVAHTRLPRKFALKAMRIDSQVREAFLERFNREGEILATIRHPHIVDVIDRNQLPDGNPYLVMELLEGEDLATYIARTGALSIPVALRICSQIGDALDAAHKVGIVHRDLKPSNIFLSKEGQVLNFVKVLDFGIAKMAATERTPMTAPSALMGTPAYMSPEQARGQQSKIDARSDQFALATVLYEMLTGKGAFFEPGDVMYAILERVVNHHPPPLKEPQINRAVMRALSKEPEQRFPTLKEFLAAVGATTHTVYSIESVVKQTPGTLSSQTGERPTMTPPRRVRRVSAFLIGGALAAAGVGIFLTVKPPQKPTLLASVDVPAVSPPTAPKQPPTIPAVPEPPPGTSGDTGVPNQTPPTTPAASPANGEAPKATPKQSSPKGPTSTPGKGGASTGRQFTIFSGGKYTFLESIILHCAREHLGPLGLRDGTQIKLERSGTLTVVDGPSTVLESGFNSCLRLALSRVVHSMLPQSVTLKVGK